MPSVRPNRPSVARLSVVLMTAAAALLASCEKPTPLVTVQSRDRSVHDEALCWPSTAAVPACDAPQRATMGAPALRTLPVRPNEPVLINVDPAVEEAGWTVLLDGEPVASEPLHTSSFRFDMPLETLRDGAVLQVKAGTPVKGEWAFAIRQRD